LMWLVAINQFRLKVQEIEHKASFFTDI